MLKNISNLGTVLSKTEQKSIKGGDLPCPFWICQNWETLVLAPACYCYA